MNSRCLLMLLAGAALALPAGAQMRQGRAVRVCQDEIRARAVDRFGTNDLRFDQITSNQNGWISGTLRVGDGPNAADHRFSCSVNPDTGYLRSARIEHEPMAYNDRGQRYGEAGRDVTASAMDSCRASVANRIRGQGDWNVRINSMNMNPDGDRVTGWARAEGRYQPSESFQFSCSVDRDTGEVLSTDLSRR